jgi:hypothetical protein
MIFDLYLLKYNAMKKQIFIITTFIVLSSCVTTKEAKLSRAEFRNEKKLTEQSVVKKAVESRRYIIKLDRLYLAGIVDLTPRSNYIIIDGEKAIISTAYLGRQYDFRGIAAIDMLGKALNYKMTSDVSKGKYEINMKIKNGNTSFDVYLTISKNGTCSVSVSSLKIDYIRYSGYIVPIKDTKTIPPSEGDLG